jgi:hypothetical protein
MRGVAAAEAYASAIEQFGTDNRGIYPQRIGSADWPVAKDGPIHPLARTNGKYLRTIPEVVQSGDFGVGKVAHPGVGAHARLAQDPAAGGAADAVDVGEGDLDPLLAWKIHACDACHDQPCRCLCLGLRLQMMRTTPCLFMTLQCSQIGFTLERTFTRISRAGFLE